MLAGGIFIYLTPPLQQRLGVRSWLKSNSLIEAERQLDRTILQMAMGANAANATKPDRALVAFLIQSAERGSVEDQLRLVSAAYDLGLDVQISHAEALSWILKAAKGGSVVGEVDLGVMYEHGTGVTKNYSQAVAWYRKAAEQGSADAEVDLGLMYMNGAGIAKDYDEALKWNRKSAEQGNAEGEVGLAVMYGLGESLPKDYGQAVEWYRKAAEQGDAFGEIRLGRMYENGEGVPKDYDKAMARYRKAAEAGDAYGEADLGVMYEDGIAKDYDMALKWLKNRRIKGTLLAKPTWVGCTRTARVRRRTMMLP